MDPASHLSRESW